MPRIYPLKASVRWKRETPAWRRALEIITQDLFAIRVASLAGLTPLAAGRYSGKFWKGIRALPWITSWFVGVTGRGYMLMTLVLLFGASRGIIAIHVVISSQLPEN